MEDELDRSILALLGAQGRMSYADLARETGLSTSAVHQRVRRLEERGVISGYRAVIEPRAIGLPLTALIDLTPLDPSAPDDIPQRVESTIVVRVDTPAAARMRASSSSRSAGSVTRTFTT